jgi:DNA modification methylase
LIKLENDSVDYIITSPPYNLGSNSWDMGKAGSASRPRGVGYADDLPYDEYMCWQIAVFNALYRVAKPGASFFYNHKCRTLDGKLIHPMAWIGDPRNPWIVRQEIVWDRKSTHNHEPRLFWQEDERIYWMTKGKPNLHPDLNIKQSTVWSEFGPVANTWHPAPFTPELPRMILRSMKAIPGQIVLDPFAGSCTTVKTALEFGCFGIGVDVCEEYLRKACMAHGWKLE